MRILNHLSTATAHLLGLVATGLAMVVGVLCVGCGNPASSSATPAKVNGSVAVVNLNTLMESMGWKADLLRDQNASRVGGEQAATAFRDALAEALKRKLAPIATAAHLTSAERDTLSKLDDAEILKFHFSADQKKEIANDFEQAKAQLSSVSQQINKIISDRSAQVVEMYRAALRPAILQAAHAKGCSIVLQPESAVFFDSSVDLTNDVLEELRRSANKPTLPDPIRYKFEDPHFNPFNAQPETAPAKKPK